MSAQLVSHGVRLPVKDGHDAFADVSACVVDKVIGLTDGAVFRVREVVDADALPGLQGVLHYAVTIRVDVSDASVALATTICAPVVVTLIPVCQLDTSIMSAALAVGANTSSSVVIAAIIL